MNIYIGTEFNEYRGALISMALIAEDGGVFYGVLECHDPGFWVAKHVMPKLNASPMTRSAFVSNLATFLDHYDHVHLIADWPEDLEHFLYMLVVGPGKRIGPDRFTMEVRRDLPNTATTSRVPHNALEDARALARSAKGLA